MFTSALFIAASAFTASAANAADAASAASAANSAPDFHRDVAPILRDFCGGCHNQKDAEEGLSVETYADLLKGSDNGPVLKPGDSSSLLLKVLKGGKPAMPPKKEPQPSPADVALIERWIAAGAPGPSKADTSILQLLTLPDIAINAAPATHITSAALSTDGHWEAVAHYRNVTLHARDASPQFQPIKIPTPGKVGQVHFSPDSRMILIATGQPGREGSALLAEAASGKLLREFRGEHRDLVCSAVFSPDGALVATGGYDRLVSLFRADTGELLRTIKGHNGAVFDLAFSPDGAVLASASADQTVKLWRVSDGERLDTLNQPQGEQLRVHFTPDAKHIVAAGNDRRIRLWEFTSKKEPALNPMLESRFAHEAPISGLWLDAAHHILFSAGGDRSLKAWSMPGLLPLKVFPKQKDVVTALLPAPQGYTVRTFDGSTATLAATDLAADSSHSSEAQTARGSEPPSPPIAMVDQAPPATEQEPNDKSTDIRQSLPIPARVRGTISQPGDRDGFRFRARKGERLVLEVVAARSGSPLKSRLDSLLEVRTLDDKPVPRALLQALRSSWLTFRGQDSNGSSDFRLQNQAEMELNELLYCEGEVLKLWHYPRGPDSGFIVYPGSGSRETRFDTTPLSHAMGSPAYTVRALAPGTTPPSNGLPIFTLNHVNDDDAARRAGSDSVLHFTAPGDGEYLAVVTDTRGFGGTEFPYELRIRAAREDFALTVSAGSEPAVSPGSGREFTLKLDRMDQFDGSVSVEFKNLPTGFQIPGPIVIQQGQKFAVGAIYAAPDAPPPTAEAAAECRMVARSEMPWGEVITRESAAFKKLTLGAAAKITVEILPDAGTPVANAAEGRPMEIRIKPGQTITALVRATRHDFKDRIELGKEDAGRNLPHGVYVDNIGLNGLLIVEEQSERQFFITASKTATEGVRPFFIRASGDGGQASKPVILRVER